MNILLFQTNTELSKELMPPIGLISLATYLRSKGVSAQVHDLSFFKDSKGRMEEILSGMPSSEETLLGFYMNTHTRFVVREHMQRARRLMPDAIISAGGPHPTLDAEDTLLKCPGLDFVVRGEGELSFAEAVERLSGSFSIASLDGVEGVSFQRDGQVTHNPLRSRISDLDELPFPDRDIVDLDKYAFSFPVKDPAVQKGLNPTSMLTSRGCPYGCIFCSVADQWGRKTTSRSVEKVMQELRYLKDKGYNAIYFFDDTFTLNRKRVVELCHRMIEERLGLTWFCEVRANTIDEELVALMQEAGLRSVAMGLESASPRILGKVINKGITLDQAREAIGLFRKYDIYCKVFFSYSYPTETLEDVEKTLDFILETRPDKPAFGRLKLYPGTPLFALAEKQGKLPEDFSWFTEYPEYNDFMNTFNVPMYKDMFTDEDLLFVDHRVNTVLAQYCESGSRLLHVVRGFLINVRKVRDVRGLKLLFEKIKLNLGMK